MAGGKPENLSLVDRSRLRLRSKNLLLWHRHSCLCDFQYHLWTAAAPGCARKLDFCGTGTLACAIFNITCGPQPPSPALEKLNFCGTGTLACAIFNITCG